MEFLVDSGFLIAFGNYFNSSSMAKVDPQKLDQDILFCTLALKGAIKDAPKLIQDLENTLDNLDHNSISIFNQASELDWLQNPDLKHYFKYIIKGIINDLYYWKS